MKEEYLNQKIDTSQKEFAMERERKMAEMRKLDRENDSLRPIDTSLKDIELENEIKKAEAKHQQELEMMLSDKNKTESYDETKDRRL